MRLGLPGIVVSLWTVGAAQAANVRGTVTLPPDGRPAEVRDGHWRVENGVLPIGPRVPDPRTEVVVVLEGGPPQKKTEDKPPGVSVDLHGLRMDPRVAVAQVGATVSFRNTDRVPHTLYIENASSLMAPESTPAGQTRSVRLFAAAEYGIRDEEYPHIDGTIVVVTTPFSAAVDERGSFKLEVPEGKYTLKVFWRGAWVLSQPLEVGPRSTDISLQLPARAPTVMATSPAAQPVKGRAE
jgi:hypothetical protein